MNRYKCHLFDVDGTLVDSSPVAMFALASCLREKGIKGLSDSVLHSLALNSPLQALKLYGINNLNSYWKFYEKEICRAKLFFDDTKNILHELKSKGCTIGVVSSLKNYQLEFMLRRFNLFNEFDVVIGWNDCSIRKPNPNPIIMALGRLNVSPATATYTGDTDSDVAAALRAGVRAIYAAWGGNIDFGWHDVTRIQNLREIFEL